MANLSEYPREDFEEEDLAALPFFLVTVSVTLWFIGSLYIGRSFSILDVVCGIGLLAGGLGTYASLNRRLQRLEQDLAHLRATVDGDPYPASSRWASSFQASPAPSRNFGLGHG